MRKKKRQKIHLKFAKQTSNLARTRKTITTITTITTIIQSTNLRQNRELRLSLHARQKLSVNASKHKRKKTLRLLSMLRKQ